MNGRLVGAKGTDRSPAKPVVLVVDDDAGTRAVLSDLLDDDFAVVTVPDGPTALEAVRTRPMDAVLLDLLLAPGPDGVQVLRALTQLRPELPVLIFTAARIEDLRRMTLGLGAYAFFRKPGDATHLVAALKDAVARRPRPRWILLLDGPGPLRWGVAAALGGVAEVEAVDPAGEAFPDRLDAPALVITGAVRAPADVQAWLTRVAAVYPGCAVVLAEESTGRGAPALPAGLDLWARCRAEIAAVVTEAMRGLRPLDPPSDLQGVSADALTLMATRYREALPVEALARALGCSASQLAHRFHAQTGLTVKACLDRIRVAAATHLLRTTPHSLGDIAKHVGVGTAATLTRLMLRVTGVRPSAVRRRGRR